MMARWVVEGADRETAEPRTIIVEADDRATAEAAGNDSGIFVSTVRAQARVVQSVAGYGRCLDGPSIPPKVLVEQTSKVYKGMMLASLIGFATAAPGCIVSETEPMKISMGIAAACWLVLGVCAKFLAWWEHS